MATVKLWSWAYLPLCPANQWRFFPLSSNCIRHIRVCRTKVLMIFYAEYNKCPNYFYAHGGVVVIARGKQLRLWESSVFLNYPNPETKRAKFDEECDSHRLPKWPRYACGAIKHHPISIITTINRSQYLVKYVTAYTLLHLTVEV